LQKVSFYEIAGSNLLQINMRLVIDTRVIRYSVPIVALLAGKGIAIV
jgi:hypothetical protein